MLNPISAHLRAAMQQSLGAVGGGGGAHPHVAPAGGLFIDPFLNCLSRHFMPPRVAAAAAAANPGSNSAASTGARAPASGVSVGANPTNSSNPIDGAARSAQSRPPQMMEHLLGSFLSGGGAASVMEQVANLFGSTGNETPGENFLTDLLILVLSNGQLALPDIMALMAGDGRPMDSSRQAVQDYLEQYLQLPGHLEAQEQLMAANTDEGFGQLLLNSFNRLIDEIISVALKSLGPAGAQRMADRLMQQYMLSMSSQAGGSAAGAPDMIQFCSQVLATRVQGRLRSGTPGFPPYLLTTPAATASTTIEATNQKASAAVNSTARRQPSEHERRILALKSEPANLPDDGDPLAYSATALTAAVTAAAAGSGAPLAPLDFPADFAPVVEADAAAMRARRPPMDRPHPLSDAYLRQQPHAKRRRVLQTPDGSQQETPNDPTSQQQQQQQQQLREPAFQLLDRLVAETAAQLGQGGPRLAPATTSDDAEFRSAFLSELLAQIRRR
uniref:CUE domain-containing protein n=1 Tax=Macrostomum lignano TaxID=282301 RepID=A0A1I8GD67_9PLAT